MLTASALYSLGMLLSVDLPAEGPTLTALCPEPTPEAPEPAPDAAAPLESPGAGVLPRRELPGLELEPEPEPGLGRGSQGDSGTPAGRGFTALVSGDRVSLAGE